MEFLQNLFSPKNSVLIAKLEVASIESVVSSLLGLLPAMGMSNPPIGTAYSKKGVVVKKKVKIL